MAKFMRTKCPLCAIWALFDVMLIYLPVDSFDNSRRGKLSTMELKSRVMGKFKIEHTTHLQGALTA